MKSSTTPDLEHRQIFAHRPKPAGPAYLYEDETLLAPRLLELVRLRTAQICNCPLCMRVHKEALSAYGELAERIGELESWRESPLYSEKERVALAISEALGSNPPQSVSKDMVCLARTHFNNAEILELTLAIFGVNDSRHFCTH